MDCVKYYIWHSNKICASTSIDRVFSLQPGYLNELLPDSAPNRPDTLDALFDGDLPSSALSSDIGIYVLSIAIHKLCLTNPKFYS